MGIAALATRLLADPYEDGRKPAMGEGEVRSQLYGESNGSNNVLTLGPKRTVHTNGGERTRSSSTGPRSS